MPESHPLVRPSEFSALPDRLRYLFIDFNAYFASVEQYDEPALRGRPVMVVPLASEHSGAIAVSYEAKAMGIRRGTTVVEARKMCPGITVRPARHDRYVALHHHLMHEIEKHLPIQRICSIDECVCRLNPDEGEAEFALAKGREIKEALYRRFDGALRCSVGLAPSAMLAKLAAELHKPDGLTVLEAGDLPHALADLSLPDIPGIGQGVATRLEKAGIRDFLSLWNLAPKQARAIWGSVTGERFLYGLHGHDVPDLPAPEKRMIGHSRVLSGCYRSPDGARIVARALLLKAASRLRHYGLYAGSLGISLRLQAYGGRRHGMVTERRFRPSQNSWRFLNALEDGWRSLVPAGSERARFASVSVTFYDLSPQPPQRDLFVTAMEDDRDKREAQLWDRIDRLNRRYKKPQLMLASQAGLDLNYLGVKIAFSRVPELAEFEDMGGLEALLGEAPIHDHDSRRLNPARALF